MPDSPTPPVPAAPRRVLTVVLQMTEDGNVHTTAEAHAGGVTHQHLVNALIHVAAIAVQNPGEAILTGPQLAALKRATVAQQYPGTTYAPAVGAYLCPACADAFASFLEGPLVPVRPVPGQPVLPCSFHIYEAGLGGVKPPMPIAEACKKAPASAPDPEAVDTDNVIPLPDQEN